MAERLPGIFAEISDTRVSSPASASRRVLCIGIKLPAGSLAVNTEKRIFSEAEAIEAGGEGSQLVQMVRAIREQNARVNLTIVAVDAPVGAAATYTLTVTGTATTAEPLDLRIEGEPVRVELAIGDDANAVAGKIDVELGLSDYDGLHTSSSVALNVVTLTAKSHGVHGNGILVEVISAPPGVSVAVAAGAAGAGAPDVDAALQALGTTRYDYVVLPDLDATNLADWISYADSLWLPDEARDGHAISFFRGTVGEAATFGLGEDTKHVSTFASPSMPDNPWEIAAVIAAARWTQANPKVSLYNDDLALAPPLEANRLNPTDRTTLLDAGIATFHYVQDAPRVERFLTLAKTNDLGQNSEAFLDLETKITVSTIRQDEILRLQPEIGKILVPDRASVQFAVGVAEQTTDVSRIRQLLITQYSGVATSFEAQGWVSDPSGFAEDLIVEQVDSTTISVTSVPRINGIFYRGPVAIEFILAA